MGSHFNGFFHYYPEQNGKEWVITNQGMNIFAVCEVTGQRIKDYSLLNLLRILDSE